MSEHRAGSELSEEERIVIEVSPEDRSAAVGREDIRGLLLNNLSERDHLSHRVRSIVENKLILNEGFCGMKCRRFENLKGDKVWRVGSVTLYISSLANRGERGDTVVVPQNLNIANNFGLSPDDVRIATLDCGDRWDIGMTLFIGGVMLDNLANVPYYMNYRDRREQLKGAIFLHHAYGLEEGRYFISQPVRVKTSERELFFESDPEHTINVLSGNYFASWYHLFLGPCHKLS